MVDTDVRIEGVVMEGVVEGPIVGGTTDGSSAGRWSSWIVCGRQNCRQFEILS